MKYLIIGYQGAKIMRTQQRTFFFILIIAGGVILFLALSKLRHPSQTAEATLDPSIPAYCVPAELTMLQEEYNQNPDAFSDGLLLEKIAANETAMVECARLATIYPPAAKPADQIGILLPTLTPLPTPEIIMGIQKAISLPIGNFIPTSMDENNYWAGTIDGKILQLDAGIQRYRDGEPLAGSADNPYRGALLGFDSAWKQIGLFPTPTRNVTIHFVKECDSLLLLQAADGTLFTFDPAQLVFVPNSAACSITY